MGRGYSWKQTEDTEIDMADLLRRLFRKWKQMAVCALACAVILGTYGWMKSRNGLSEEVSETEKAELTETEEQAVAAAVLLEHEIQELETYLEHSEIMKIDPYHKSRFVMLYSINHAERWELQKITESYLNFILNGGAADTLQKSGRWKLDKTYLMELIGAYQKTDSFSDGLVTNNADESGWMPEALFYVEVTGKDSVSARKIAEDVQKVLKEYAAEVKKAAGSHRLVLINSMESITADIGLQSQQRDKRSLLSSDKANLKTMTDAFNNDQLAVYTKDTGRKDKADREKAEHMTESGGFRLNIKYVICGLAGGIFIYSCLFSCWYVFDDSVKSTNQLKVMYTFPFYGSIVPGRRKKGGVMAEPDRKLEDGGHGTASVLNRIRLSCKKQGVTRLYAVSDFSLDVQEKECLEDMGKQLKNWHIDMLKAESADADTVFWDHLAETGNVLMVCRIGTTTHRMIDDAMSFYLENGISVMGAAVFLE